MQQNGKKEKIKLNQRNECEFSAEFIAQHMNCQRDRENSDSDMAKKTMIN